MTHYTANVTRDGKWWMITVPGIDGLTQARRLGEAELMAREYIAGMTDAELDDVTVDLTITIDHLDAGARAEQIRAERQQAAALEARILAESKDLARTLAECAVPVRDIGELLGISFQRASQLLHS